MSISTALAPKEPTLQEPSQFQLLRAITQSGPMSRTELAECTGLSKASVTMLTRGLIERGMLHEAGTVHGAGRPSIKLGLDGAAAYFVGVSLLDEPIMLLADLHGAVRCMRPLHADSLNPAAIGHRIRALLPDLAGVAGVARDRIRGIGLAVSGVIDTDRQLCIQSTLLGWRDLPVARLIEDAVGLPTVIENDANAVTMGEVLSGRIGDCSCFCLISVGEGIGCGMFVQGAIHRGHHGGAGELAHLTIEPGGIPCPCGKRGCLDTIASLNAIRGAAAKAGLPGNMQALEELAASGPISGPTSGPTSGQAHAVRILHRAGSALGLAIAHLIQLLDPQQIVIVRLDDGKRHSRFETAIRQTIESNVLPGFAHKTVIHSRGVSKDVWAQAWAQGAACVAAHGFMFGRFAR